MGVQFQLEPLPGRPSTIEELELELVVDASVGRQGLLLEALGLHGEGESWGPDWGVLGGEELLGRVLVAQGLAEGREVPPVQEGRWFDGGIRAGWLADKLGELHGLAEEARLSGRRVVWG